MRSTLTGKSPRASQGSSEHSSRTMFKRRSFRVAALFCMRAHRSLVVVSVSAMETQRMGEMSLLDGACLIGRVLCQMGRENVERCRRGGRVFGHVSWWHPLSRRIGVGHVRGSRKRRVGSVFERWTHAMPLQESVAMMVPRCSARQLGRGKLRRTRSVLAFLRNQPRGALRCMRVRRKRRGRMPFALGNGV